MVPRGQLRVLSRPQDEVVAENAHVGGSLLLLAPGTNEGFEYDYLLTMPLRSLPQDKVTALQTALPTRQALADTVANTWPEQMWKADLGVLRAQWLTPNQG